MDQFSNVLLYIENIHTVSLSALDCRPGLGGFDMYRTNATYVIEIRI